MNYKNFIFATVILMLAVAFCEIMGWTELYNTFGWISIIVMLFIVPFVVFLVGMAWYNGIKDLIEYFKPKKQ